MDTKVKKIRDWLEAGNTITQLDATEMFGTTRLSSIIFQLRRCYNLNIVTIMEEGTDRFGNKIRYGRYKLGK